MAGIGIGISPYMSALRSKGAKPPADTSLTVIPISNTAFTLTWELPASPNVSKVIVEGSADGLVWETDKTLGAVETVDITGLENNTLRYFRLVLVGPGGYRSKPGIIMFAAAFYQADMNTYATKRTGTTIKDIINGNDIQILTPTFKSDTTATIEVVFPGGQVERIYDGNQYTVYIKCKFIVDGVARMLRLGNSTLAGQRGLSIYTIATQVRTKQCDGTNVVDKFTTGGTGTAIFNTELGWFEILVNIDPVTKLTRFRFYKASTGELISPSLDFNADISSFVFTDSDNFEAYRIKPTSPAVMAYADFKKFTGIKTIEQCRNNNYSDGLQFYYPEIISGTDVSGNGNHAKVRVATNTHHHYDLISTYMLDKGYTLMKEDVFKTTPADPINLYVPNDVYGNNIIRESNTIRFSGDNFIPKKLVKGDINYINLAICKVRFALGSKWDRSNTTIFSDLARAEGTWYDSENPTDWHISELGSVIIKQWINVGQNYSFVKGKENSSDKRNLLETFISFDNNKLGEDLTKVETFTGDYKDPKTYTTGQLVVTFDDGKPSLINNGVPLLKSKGVSATVYLIVGATGAANNNVMNWENVKELNREGFDIQDHFYAHDQLTTLTEEELIEGYDKSNVRFELYGIPRPKHVAYPHGDYNDTVKTVTSTKRLTGRRVVLTGPFDSTVDKMAVPAFAIDTLSEERLTLLKGYMDIARTNNTIVLIYGHDVNMAGGTTTAILENIIDYARTIGLEIVTMSEIYDNVLSV